MQNQSRSEKPMEYLKINRLKYMRFKRTMFKSTGKKVLLIINYYSSRSVPHTHNSCTQIITPIGDSPIKWIPQNTEILNLKSFCNTSFVATGFLISGVENSENSEGKEGAGGGRSFKSQYFKGKATCKMEFSE